MTGVDHIARLASGYDFSGMSDAELVGDMRGFNAAARTIRVDVACALAVALMLEAARRLDAGRVAARDAEVAAIMADAQARLTEIEAGRAAAGPYRPPAAYLETAEGQWEPGRARRRFRGQFPSGWHWTRAAHHVFDSWRYDRAELEAVIAAPSFSRILRVPGIGRKSSCAVAAVLEATGLVEPGWSASRWAWAGSAHRRLLAGVRADLGLAEQDDDAGRGRLGYGDDD